LRPTDPKKEKKREQNRRYRLTHSEKKRENDKNYYLRTKEERQDYNNARMREYRRRLHGVTSHSAFSLLDP
jgi:hypothetical protein